MERQKKKPHKNFCDRGPVCFAISLRKEICKRHLQDFLQKVPFAKQKQTEKLPCVVAACSSHLIKTGPGIDPVLQQNKAVNIRLACAELNGLLILPGEVFSFWHTVGNTTRRKGYLDGRVIEGNRLKPGIGGGLCNLGNTVHRVILHSPMTVTEFHSHSDALAPDEGERVPFATGTSISYNSIDYRFRNDTRQPVQLLTWCEGDTLFAELRSEQEFPWTYALEEEGHHFQKEGDRFYRVSKIYRLTYDRKTGEMLEKKLVLDNHSEVMFDYALLPKDQIRQEED